MMNGHFVRSLAHAGLALGIVCGTALAADRNQVVIDGMTLSYLEAGDHDAPPLVLLHGYTDSSHDWALVIDSLAEHFRVYALDQRGHGDSDAPRFGYSVHRYAADVIEFMESVGIEQTALAGFSMGGVVASQTAILAPEKISRMVLLSTTASAVGNEALAWTWGEIQEFDTGIPAEFLEAWSHTENPVPASFLEQMIEIQQSTPLHVWRGAARMLMEHDHSDFLSDIEAPTLILWGDNDSFFSREDQNRLLSMIPNSELRVYEGVGHNTPWEMPDLVTADMIQFLSE